MKGNFFYAKSKDIFLINSKGEPIRHTKTFNLKAFLRTLLKFLKLMIKLKKDIQ